VTKVEEEARGARERLFRLYSEVLGPQGWGEIEEGVDGAAKELEGFWGCHRCPPGAGAAARKGSLGRSRLTVMLVAER